MKTSIKFAVVGTGCIGREHIRNMLIAPSSTLELVACVDNDAKSLQLAAELVANKKVALYSSVDELISNDVAAFDAVVVAVPNHLHVEVCETFLEKTQAHILCEKPVATTLEDCERLARTIEQNGKGRIFAVGLEYRHIPTMKKLTDTLPTIGDLRLLTIREHRFPFLRKVGLWNRDGNKTGGTLVEKGCHFFDFFRLCTKRKPTTVYARGGQCVNFIDSATDVLDHAVVLLDFDGIVCTLELCMFAEASANQLEVSAIGDKGKVEAFAPAHGVKRLDPSKPNFRVSYRQPLDWENAKDAPPESHTIGAVYESHIAIDPHLLAAGDHAGATYYELIEFAQACQQPELEPNLATIYEATLSVAMGIAAQRSIEQKCIVDLRDILSQDIYDSATSKVKALSLNKPRRSSSKSALS
mmetsp:Transcript_2266/g.2949  ORF Transcript_2266/g.2949 Transcript_2266/m.2949 type:complete len:413 (-) Transcript_2266:255-1493(-)|eukprot:CAMPEP_0197311204 /NCGR_PEP_ID=MMETSP0891-20130614/9701_1 /TAXON_ID=44058 ORGANISM="Aureoumbra lagunensis, Strain CCMP1510" /NCGR_SAMPLE_ID=MMETSP0891 /ASSEMBLY_ACC=CAM_ASM_000534 /LENGTH=412 /DNA_ID=CAMNT_0042797191 /DNA_START=125 /DNA_END=1363 /DNA_ORIENTATION=-